ncbi:DUF3971 domain-containing protein [Acidocella sp. MX-AZ02]|uniref:YhdP family protein n=1 Tax=Acidocella sp. MX-AZ02 TaxID=1214225 RepID=UPI00028D79B9|nr:DUF3971 domain-containing protein [Acidocella sp. MX-AZ02]EKN00203.1 hypothetical protein MXAZACID_06571 [Acidocella sp. MX-AZ02]
MKFRRGQAAWIIIEAIHQLGRIVALVVLLALALFGLLGFRLAQGPLEIPQIASRIATRLSGEGVEVRIGTAELAWAGYHKGGAVPLVLRLADIKVGSDSGGALADIPAADLTLPVADLFGGRDPIALNGAGATFPGGNVPVSWHADLWPGRGFTLSHGAVHARIGAGRIGTGVNRVALSDASFTLAVLPDGAVQVSDGVAQLAPQGQSAPRLYFSFRAHRDGLWLGRLNVALDSVQAQDLAAYWPPIAAPDARVWVMRNITAGSAHDAQFSIDMAAHGDLSHFKIENVQGGFQASDLTLHFLPGAVPLEHLDGVFTMPGMDTILIDAGGGAAGGVGLQSGSMVITDLTAKDQFGFLSLNLAGPVQNVLGILGAPPLNLLAHTPPDIKGATGTLAGTLAAMIPLAKNVTARDVQINVATQLSDVKMATPIPGIYFTDGAVRIATDGETLRADATAQLAGAPASLTLTQDVSKPDGAETLDLQGEAGPALWHAFGLDTPSGFTSATQGSAPFRFSLSGPADGTQEAALEADLTRIGLALPLLGWVKQPGGAGRLAARFSLENGDLGAIQDFMMEAPGLFVRGHSQGRVFTLTQADIGRSQAQGSVIAPARPGQPWQIEASGETLDLRHGADAQTQPDQPAPAAPPQPAPSGPLWQARLAFQHLYITKPPAPGLRNVSLTASGQGQDLSQASASADGMSAQITPLAGPRRALALQGQDAGALLRVLGVYDGMQGGALDLRAQFGGGPAQGTLKLAQARLVNAPGFIKLMQAATLYGVAEAMSGPGLLIDHATIPFTLEGGVLRLNGADAYSESLGFTASGSVDGNTGICDLQTTIVPAYALNALPGKIPVLGHLFSAEKGGGLFAVRAHVQGKMSNPQIHVNPLSALTPGFLRGVFGLGSGAPPATKPAAP